jgi:uncharacterized protein (TIGR02646 family)
MRRLNRQSVDVPSCLVNPPEDRTYGNLRREQKAEIRQKLLHMQGNRCAYCERRTGKDAHDGHVEHFRSQATHPHRELEWCNLFWSCTDQHSCGKHKDDCNLVGGTGRKRAFTIDDILDPSIDDPDEYLLFVHDGTVRPRGDLSPNEARRAEETLRVFNLDQSSFLQDSRADAVRPYITSVDALLSLGVEIVRKYVQSQLPIIDEQPFSTAIKHYLGGLIR